MAIIENSAAAAQEQIKDVTNTPVVKCDMKGLLNQMSFTVWSELLKSADTVAVHNYAPQNNWYHHRVN